MVPRDADAVGGVLDDSKDEQPRSGQGVDFEEVGGQESLRLAAQEGGPGEVITVRRRLDAVDLEDFPDSGRRDRDSQDGEFTVDSPVAPTGVLACQRQDKDSDATDSRASTGSSGAGGLRVAAALQVAVPAQDGVGRDEQEEPSQRWSGEFVEQGGEERPVGRSERWSVDLAL